MKFKIIIALMLIPLLCACHTMRFKQSPSSPVSDVGIAGDNFDRWHHVGIISLVEFSKPITVKNQGCNSWNSVTIQRSFLPGLVSSFPYVGVFYSPWDAYMSCN